MRQNYLSVNINIVIPFLLKCVYEITRKHNEQSDKGVAMEGHHIIWQFTGPFCEGNFNKDLVTFHVVS
jgi:hypothetical protein